MKCPKCGHNKNGVIDTGTSSDLGIPRIRKCKKCDQPFQTVEVRRDALYRAIGQLFETSPICVTGEDYCEYLSGSSCKGYKCDIIKRKKSPLLCRGFYGEWK